MLVRDFVEVPLLALHVIRNQSEGAAQAKTPKSGEGPVSSTAPCRTRCCPITAPHLHHLGDSADRSALQLLNDTAPSAGRARRQPAVERRGDFGVIR